MLLRSVRAFLSVSEVREIVIPLPAEYLDSIPAWLDAICRDRVHAVAGGDTRATSVRRGFEVLSSACHIVLVHDAARPFVSRATIDQIVEKTRKGVSAIAAVPVRDTLKRTDASHTIIETVSRDGMWQAQTPQGFPRDVLVRAYAHAAEGDAVAITDEASLVERAGFPVHVVPDSTTNIKVTTREDFVLANALAQQ